MVFDNGTHRALPPDEKMPGAESYSRAVEFAVDPGDMTVTQLWAYGGPGPDRVFATYQGGALRLPETGNIFITHGGTVTDKEGRFSKDNFNEHCSARLMEVTYGLSPEKVFEMIIDDQSINNPVSYSVFRSEHLLNLYPSL